MIAMMPVVGPVSSAAAMPVGVLPVGVGLLRRSLMMGGMPVGVAMGRCGIFLVSLAFPLTVLMTMMMNIVMMNIVMMNVNFSGCIAMRLDMGAMPVLFRRSKSSVAFNSVIIFVIVTIIAIAPGAQHSGKLLLVAVRKLAMAVVRVVMMMVVTFQRLVMVR